MKIMKIIKNNEKHEQIIGIHLNSWQINKNFKKIKIMKNNENLENHENHDMLENHDFRDFHNFSWFPIFWGDLGIS